MLSGMGMVSDLICACGVSPNLGDYAVFDS
jgi:hypothetical protein